MRRHRFQITLAAVVLCAVSSLALAQGVACKKTETQAECHARLKCKANEELEDCQKRLLKCRADEKLDECEKRAGASGQQGNGGEHQQDTRRDGNADRDDRGDRHDRDDRGDRRDRDDRGDRRDRDDRRDDGRDDRGDRRDRSDGGGRARSHRGHAGFSANKTFGLGLEVGEPTGLNGKYFVSESGALDFGVGWIYDHYYYGDGIHLYADYLWHFPLASASTFELPFYIGGGLRYWDFHYCVQGLCDYGGSAIGIRVPLGISFDFNNVPLDIFLQLVPVLDFLNGDYYSRYNNREHVGIDGSAGIRFWFK